MAIPSAVYTSAWATYSPAQKIAAFNAAGTTVEELAGAGVPQSDISWMLSNGYAPPAAPAPIQSSTNNVTTQVAEPVYQEPVYSEPTYYEPAPAPYTPPPAPAPTTYNLLGLTWDPAASLGTKQGYIDTLLSQGKTPTQIRSAISAIAPNTTPQEFSLLGVSPLMTDQAIMNSYMVPQNTLDSVVNNLVNNLNTSGQTIAQTAKTYGLTAEDLSGLTGLPVSQVNQFFLNAGLPQGTLLTGSLSPTTGTNQNIVQLGTGEDRVIEKAIGVQGDKIVVQQYDAYGQPMGTRLASPNTPEGQGWLQALGIVGGALLGSSLLGGEAAATGGATTTGGATATGGTALGGAEGGLLSGAGGTTAATGGTTAATGGTTAAPGSALAGTNQLIVSSTALPTTTTGTTLGALGGGLLTGAAVTGGGGTTTTTTSTPTSVAGKTLPSDWNNYTPQQKISWYNTNGITPADLTAAGVDQATLDWMSANGYTGTATTPVVGTTPTTGTTAGTTTGGLLSSITPSTISSLLTGVVGGLTNTSAQNVLGGLISSGANLAMVQDAADKLRQQGQLTQTEYTNLANRLGGQYNTLATTASNMVGDFTPYGVTGSLFGTTYNPATNTVNTALTEDARAMYNPFAVAAMQSAQAANMTNVDQLSRDYYNKLSALSAPEIERQRLATEARLRSQGRLGVSGSSFGGSSPELLAQEQAIAQQQLQRELQSRQAALGERGTLLGQGVTALQPIQNLTQQQLAQAQLSGQLGQQAMAGNIAQTNAYLQPSMAGLTAQGNLQSLGLAGNLQAQQEALAGLLSSRQNVANQVLGTSGTSNLFGNLLGNILNPNTAGAINSAGFGTGLGYGNQDIGLFI
jgi:hypothetical protein